MSAASVAISTLKTVLELAEKHPSAVSAIEEIAATALKSKDPSETADVARRAALAAAAEEFIQS